MGPVQDTLVSFSFKLISPMSSSIFLNSSLFYATEGIISSFRLHIPHCKGRFFPFIIIYFTYLGIYLIFPIQLNKPFSTLRTGVDFLPVSDVAGEVTDVGSAVKDFKAGDKVVSMLSVKNGGGLAQYAVASSNLTVRRPPEVSPADGASLPIAACTALQALKSGGAKFDDTRKPLNVLITAASGGVGSYAVQLAKLADLHVTATCGARNIELVKSLGADEVLDYKSSDGAKLKSPSGKKYDAVVHCTVGIEWSTFEPNLSDNGKVIDITPSPKTFLNSAIKKVTFAKKKIVPLLAVPNKEDLQFLVGLVKEGRLKTVVDSRYPLSRAEEAWAKSIDGHATGKIIVEI